MTSLPIENIDERLTSSTVTEISSWVGSSETTIATTPVAVPPATSPPILRVLGTLVFKHVYRCWFQAVGGLMGIYLIHSIDFKVKIGDGRIGA